MRPAHLDLPRVLLSLRAPPQPRRVRDALITPDVRMMFPQLQTSAYFLSDFTRRITRINKGPRGKLSPIDFSNVVSLRMLRGFRMIN